MFYQVIGNLIGDILYIAGYIANNNSFPEPLDTDEENKYIQMYQSGDENAKNVLIEHNLRLVVHIAKKYSQDKEIDELISIGTIGLIKAITTFKPDKNIRLGTYAARCIENELLMYFRAGKKISNEVFLDEPIGSDKEGNTMTFLDILSCSDNEITDGVILKSEIKQLYEIMNRVLKENELKIIQWRYGLNNETPKSQKEIASLLGISRSYVSRIEKKAIEKIASEIEK